MSVLATFVKPLAYVSLPLFALHTLAGANPVARYYVRIGLYLSTLGVCSLWGALCAVGMSLVGRRLDVFYIVARSFYYLASRAVDIRLVVEGEEHLETRPSVLVGNHQSMLDILYLGRIFPRRASIMAKKELQWVPLLGQFMTLGGAVFVDRGNNARAVRSLTAAGEIMKERHSSLWVFPEGTRSMRPHCDMLPLKKGAFHTAIQAGVPIVPVVCENYWRLYRQGVFDSGTLKVRVLPPVPTTGLTSADASDLAVRVHDLMVDALREISVPAPSAPSEKPRPAPASAPPSQEPQPPVNPIPAPATVEPTPLPEPEELRSDSPAESHASTGASSELSAMSSPVLTSSRVEGSENGTETEEDDGMVLVGRPK
ncbi:putative 1-acyl-sn-glycerol-3-phosphate acyltransferase [Grifola frondosa]|uniref:1-acyl-sn-glycerol-3-phosphate acyltransferase n=1 Tax=Grifola frondosa TaxID=5627 RepID=A0A1C7LZM4_GRIFR|nr:putative 1-acyl-sn-glycerol-3-phosphate acyltransferase [Grifola frondosa]